MRRKRLGLGMHSYGAHWKAAQEKSRSTKFSDALEFLRYAREIGAGGVQVVLGDHGPDYALKLRRFAEENGLYFEAQASLPREESEVARFEAEVRLAREAGAQVMRTALLNGRRYETFASARTFDEFRAQGWRSLTMAEPVLKRHGLRLAVENHKDWLSGEFVTTLRRLSSEYIGACVDIGNNIALLEDPVAVVEALAPYAFATHIKDMAVADCVAGFLLSEVPLGQGVLDLPRIINILQTAKPDVQFTLEMITRDALQIACLSDKYWITMGEIPASRLAATLGLVREHGSKMPLPHTAGLSAAEQLAAEERNVRLCLDYAREKLAL